MQWRKVGEKNQESPGICQVNCNYKLHLSTKYNNACRHQAVHFYIDKLYVDIIRLFFNKSSFRFVERGSVIKMYVIKINLSAWPKCILHIQSSWAKNKLKWVYVLFHNINFFLKLYVFLNRLKLIHINAFV